MTTHHSPNIFELLACDRLKEGLREAFRYLIDNLNQIEGFRRLPLPPTDETVLLLDLLIEFNYLKTYNASYAENLYGLLRLSRSSKEKTNILPSLVCLTLVPYCKRKLDKYFENLHYKDTRTADELNRIRIYRLVSRSGSFLNLLCMLRYTAKGSDYHNILDGLINVCLKSRLDEDGNDEEDSSLMDLTCKRLADSMGKALTLGSYVIQFLDYWNTHSNSTPLFNASLPIPEPPKRDGLAYTDDRSSSICLICEHVRQNECALSNTGYVFCYSCIQKYVKSKQKCPVTGQAANLDNIVKLCHND